MLKCAPTICLFVRAVATLASVATSKNAKPARSVFFRTSAIAIARPTLQARLSDACAPPFCLFCSQEQAVLYLVCSQEHAPTSPKTSPPSPHSPTCRCRSGRGSGMMPDSTDSAAGLPPSPSPERLAAQLAEHAHALCSIAEAAAAAAAAEQLSEGETYDQQAAAEEAEGHSGGEQAGGEIGAGGGAIVARTCAECRQGKTTVRNLDIWG